MEIYQKIISEGKNAFIYRYSYREKDKRFVNGGFLILHTCVADSSRIRDEFDRIDELAVDF